MNNTTGVIQIFTNGTSSFGGQGLEADRATKVTSLISDDGAILIDALTTVTIDGGTSIIFKDSGTTYLTFTASGANSTITPAGSLTLASAPGIQYSGVTHASKGTANQVGFTWTSPNLFGHVDDSNTITIGTASDRRLKTDIETITDGIERIRRYRPVSFIPLEFDGTTVPDASRHKSFIADEVEKIDESLVLGEAKEGSFQSVHLAGLLPDVVSALQSIDARVAALEAA